MSVPIIFKESPLGITANKLNLAFAQLGTGTGTGDMTKAVYDINANGIVDTAESVPWTGVTGKPALDPGAWTTPTFATGWSNGGLCAYRVQSFGAVQTVFCRGIASQAAAAASLAFNLPAGARPAATRICQVAGQQQETDATQSLVIYGVTIATSGDANFYPIIKYSAVWPLASLAQNVYLDSLNFSL